MRTNPPRPGFGLIQEPFAGSQRYRVEIDGL